jgi:Zn-dependent protease with chaperone function
MTFFEQQDQARRKTGRLVVLFVIAVVLILAAINLATFGILRLVSPHLSYAKDAAPVFREDVRYPGTLHPVEPMWTNPLAYAGVSLATLVIIAGGSLYKTASLSRGGHAVASLLGGRPLDPQMARGPDRVLQNVVEEMSIASGVPVPTVYVMENEQGINAFAAGFTTEDAVIGVTRGCVDKLTRDELQGVVAHEFSHILNGDMRLNIRLIGILHGILVIALIGYGILRFLPYTRGSGSRRSGKDSSGQIIILIMLAGAAMLVIGYVGVFFGRLIQAAVSRQREYLADASAVQFTRNPRGIAGALMKIASYSAGSRVENHHAVETAHLFFASGIKIGLTSMLATHPPILERIKRIDPTFDGRLPSAAELPPPTYAEEPEVAAATGFAPKLPSSADAIARARRALDPSGVVARAGAPSAASMAMADRLLRSLPRNVAAAAHDPYSARAVVFALLVSRDAEVRSQQLAQVAAVLNAAAQRELAGLVDAVNGLHTAARLPLLDLSLPALRRMSPQQIAQFRTMVRALVAADRQVSLFEFALLRILDQHLRSPDAPARRGPVQYFAVNAVRDEAAVVLSALASASDADTQQAFTAGARRLDSENPPALVRSASLSAVDDALERLAAASPAVKQRVIDACAHAVAVDGQVTVAEAELLRAIASTMDIPLPPLVALDALTAADRDTGVAPARSPL